MSTLQSGVAKGSTNNCNEKQRCEKNDSGDVTMHCVAIGICRVCTSKQWNQTQTYNLFSAMLSGVYRAVITLHLFIVLCWVSGVGNSILNSLFNVFNSFSCCFIGGIGQIRHESGPKD